MSFHEVRLPPEVSYGAQGGPKFQTTIMTLANGHERRNVDWKVMRCEYDVSYGIKTKAEMDAVRAFFYARRGMAYGFRFKDWNDYRLDLQEIGTTVSAAARTFQLFKRYQSGVSIYDRVLNKIVTGTLTVTVDGTPVTQGAGAGQYQVDLNTGLITLGSTIGGTAGRIVRASCEFDVPVRFDIDHLQATLEEFNVENLDQIPLVEVRV